MNRGVFVALLATAVLLTACVTVVACFFPAAASASIASLAVIGLAIVTIRGARHSPQGPSAPWHWAVLLLPLSLAMRVQNEMLSMFALLALLVWAFTRRRSEARVSASWTVYVFLVAALLVVVRSPLASILTAAISIVILWRSSLTSSTKSMIVSIIDGAGLYVIANAVGYYALGQVAPNFGTKTIGLAASDGGLRVFFPLSSSLNLAPAVASAAIVGALYLFFLESGARRYFRAMSILAGAAILLGADGRVSVAVALSVGLCALVAPALLRWAAPVVVVSALTLPFYFRATSEFIATQAPSLISSLPGLDRGGGLAGILSFNGRSIIWGQSVDYWLTFVGGPPRWIGFGSDGQYVSGASKGYAWLFGNAVALSEHTSVHNSLLQQLYDGGLLGATLLLVAVLASMYLMSRKRAPDFGYRIAALSVTVALALSAATEVTLAPGMSNETFWIFGGLVFAVGMRREGPSESRPSPAWAMTHESAEWSVARV